jgi:hypothetical protein
MELNKKNLISKEIFILFFFKTQHLRKVKILRKIL